MRRLVYILLVLPLCCAAVKPYVPQTADPLLEPWRWREMTELGYYGIRCMDEAPDGSLWFGATGGLVRYDGMQIEWVPFGEELKAAAGLQLSRDLWCYNVLCMPDGSLLAVIESTLLQWKDGKWTVLLKGLGGAEFESRLVRADNGTIWLFRPKTLWRFSPDLSRHDVVLKALPQERLSSFCLDGKGDAWISVERSSGSVDLLHIPLRDGHLLGQTQWSSYPVAHVKPSREVSICAGPDGKIWYTDSRGGNALCSFDSGKKEWTEADHPEASRGRFFLFRDRHDTIWAGGAGSLFAMRQSDPRFYSADTLGLPVLPFSVFEAENNSWWVIVRGGHVYRIDTSFKQWKTLVDLQFECESTDGTQWFLDSGRNVVKFDPVSGQWNSYNKKEVQVGQTRSLYADSHGFVWAIGSHSGQAVFSIYDGSSWIRYTPSSFGSSIGEGAVFQAKDGTIWLGCAGGENLKDSSNAGGALQYEVKDGRPQLLKHYTDSQFPYAISRFAQTPDGTIWLGAPAIFSFMPGENGRALEVPDLPSVFTYDLTTDAKGDLWLAKGLHGVFHRKSGEWNRYMENGGLRGKIFVDLLPLPDETLLAASDRGINRFDGASWCNVFSEDFGMSSRSCSIRRSSEGFLWFNYSSKDSRSPRVIMNLTEKQDFCTVRYTADTKEPATFTDYFPEQVDSAGNITISWSGRDPWENTPSDQLQYSWRMDQGEWSPFSNERQKTFLDLASGQHTLEVRARDRDFNIDPRPVQNRFFVALPVWQRTWFILLVLIAVAGTGTCIGLWIYYHDKRLKDRARHFEEIDQLKTGFFTNISHELRTPLTIMQGPLEDLLEMETGEEKRFLLSMVKRSGDRVSNLVSQLLDLRTLEQGKMKMHFEEGDFFACVREAVDALRPMAETNQIVCETSGDGPFIGQVDVDILIKITTNLVVNAIKYSSAGSRIHVMLRAVPGDNSMLLLVVEDHGVGIKPQDLKHVFDRFYRASELSEIDGSGIGLNLTQELVTAWGGSIQVESPIHADPDCPGARFSVKLPLKGNRNER